MKHTRTPNTSKVTLPGRSRSGLSIKPLLNVSSKSRDGRHTLVLQLIYKRRRGLLFTHYRLLPEEFDAAEGRAVSLDRRKSQIALAREVNLFLEHEREEVVRIFLEYLRGKQPFTVRDLTTAYRQRFDNRYVHTFFLRQIEELRREGSHGTANKYHNTLVAFEKFAGSRRMHFAQIDEKLLLDFEQYLRQVPLQPNTVVFYMSNFRAVYNKALKRGYVSGGVSPFGAVSLRAEKTRKLAVGVDIVRRVAAAEFPDSDKLSCARDLFMFSFYTRGMSFVDMAYLRQDDIQGGVIRYRRRKTGQIYVVQVLPQVQRILDRYRERCSPWALPVMFDTGEDGRISGPLVCTGTTSEERRAFEARVYLRYKYTLTYYLRFYREMGERLGLPVRLSFNVARHTWASLARDKGIPVSVISVSLGHTSERTTQIYLDELDNKRVNEANELVAGLLEEPVLRNPTSKTRSGSSEQVKDMKNTKGISRKTKKR